MTQAVILAGGKGTRLASALNGKPKCLVEVDGIPLLQRQLQLLKAFGISDVIMLVSHAVEYIVRFLEENDNFGLTVKLIDDGNPLGTSGSVLAALDSLDDSFVVLYGDTLLNVDFHRFIGTHKQSRADATLFLHPNDHPADSDLVEIDDEGWVQAFHPYPHEPSRHYANLVNAALYVIEKSALQPWRNYKTPSDFGKDLFPAMLAAGGKLKGYPSFEYIRDVGTPKRLLRASEELRKGIFDRASLTQKQKAVFLDRDGTLNFHRGFICTEDQFELMPGVAEAIKKLNEAEFRTALITNQPVIARGEATLAEVKMIHAKLESKLGEAGAFLDGIFICPHHPDSGFAGEVAALKIDCECRKPKLGMVDSAVRELNIDLTRSWLIGDTTMDLETARRTGVKSVLVRTGESGKDGKYAVHPTYVADNLGEAVDLILRESEVP